MDLNTKLIECLTKRFTTIYNYFDSQITRNLNESNIETRPAKRNGLWCCALLPTVLMMYNMLYKVSPVYSVVTYNALGMLFYCMLFIIFMSVSCLVLKETIYGGCLASSLVSALLLYAFLRQDLTFSLLFSLPTIFAFSVLLRTSLIQFPKTFTVGEAMVVSQSILLYVLMVVTNAMSDDTIDEEMGFINAVVNTMLSSVGLIVTAVCVMNDEHKDLHTFGYLLAGAAIYALIMLENILGFDCLIRIVAYAFFVNNRIYLVLFWMFLLVISVLVVQMRTKLAVKASTVTRKSFHVLASIVFMSGIIYDQNLMLLAAGVGLGLLILVEALRKSGIEPISRVLQSAFLVYSDEKDCGVFAMTPLYLYCGLACPLLLVPGGGVDGGRGRDQLALLSGVLSIGVGDTAASWFGSRYGFNKWPNSNKSLEGTTFNILSQILTVYTLEMFELIDVKNALVRTTIAATVSGFVEAKTEQVDNLVLPLVMLFAFQITWFLS